MSRIPTTYKNPSVADRIAGASDVHQLAKLRSAILVDLGRGAIRPESKTLSRWENELWRRVLALLHEARSGSALTLIWNVCLNWTRPNEETAQFLRAEFERLAREMPSPSEQST